MAPKSKRIIPKKHKAKFIFILNFSLLLLLVLSSAALYHLFRIPVHLTLLPSLLIIFMNAFYTARYAFVLGAIVSSAILGALFIGVGFQLFIQLQVYTFWFQTVNVVNYIGIAGAMALMSVFMAVIAAQLSFRLNYRQTESKRHKKYKNKYGETAPHPDLIKPKA
ncbi:hypothetical protein CYPRO_3227 [Cyclonatronum proteinivorum]|uniref:Uncharacterized protein n=1 Tax=Cyclonatronum proteinivorum TaxID=1457365 RepID=A0A345UPQ8_9BACT|nr:hypothetical protein [Cyclonatronum proteinivorum]AXJ02460.1 hypothetical protein CYPRO_3227 [Cyclonatronum proteinivorum]